MSSPTVLPPAAVSRLGSVTVHSSGRFAGPALARGALLLTPVPVAAAATALAPVPWPVLAAAAAAGWCALGALVHLGRAMAAGADPVAAARLVLGGFAAVAALFSLGLTLAPAEWVGGGTPPLAYVVGLAVLGFAAAVATALVTGAEPLLLRWCVPVLLIAVAALAGPPVIRTGLGPLAALAGLAPTDGPPPAVGPLLLAGAVLPLLRAATIGWWGGSGLRWRAGRPGATTCGSGRASARVSGRASARVSASVSARAMTSTARDRGRRPRPDRRQPDPHRTRAHRTRTRPTGSAMRELRRLGAPALRQALAYLLLGGGQVAAVWLVWRAGHPGPGTLPPALVPLLVAVPAGQLWVAWHLARIAAGLARYDDPSAYQRYLRGLNGRTLAALLPPLVAAAALATAAPRLPYALSTHPDPPAVVLALATGLLLAGVLATGWLLAERGRPALAAGVTGVPVLSAIGFVGGLPELLGGRLSASAPPDTRLLAAVAVALAVAYGAGLVLAAQVLSEGRNPR